MNEERNELIPSAGSTRQCVHELKTWPEFFEAVKIGIKRFEIRKNDRGFEVGDTLQLKEYDPKSKTYSGDELEVFVTYMTDYNQRLGFVVMGIEPLPL